MLSYSCIVLVLVHCPLLAVRGLSFFSFLFFCGEVEGGKVFCAVSLCVFKEKKHFGRTNINKLTLLLSQLNIWGCYVQAATTRYPFRHRRHVGCVCVAYISIARMTEHEIKYHIKNSLAAWEQEQAVEYNKFG